MIEHKFFQQKQGNLPAFNILQVDKL